MTVTNKKDPKENRCSDNSSFTASHSRGTKRYAERQLGTQMNKTNKKLVSFKNNNVSCLPSTSAFLALQLGVF